MYSIDELTRFNTGSMMSRGLDRARGRAGVRRLPRTNDVDAFLSACGLTGKRR